MNEFIYLKPNLHINGLEIIFSLLSDKKRKRMALTELLQIIISVCKPRKTSSYNVIGKIMGW